MEFKLGDTVNIKENARYLDTNAKVSSKACKKSWTIVGINSNKIKLSCRDSEDIFIDESYLIKYDKKKSVSKVKDTKKSQFDVGCKVIIKDGSTWCNGEPIPKYYIGSTMFVLRSDELITELGDKSRNKVGSVYTKDLRIKK